MKQLPTFSHLPISSLAGVFNNTTNSYKLYWFYAILQIIRTEDKNVISLDEITSEMISSAWYTVNYFKISFGKQDKLRQAVADIQKISNLPEDASPTLVKSEITKRLTENKALQKIISDFHRYVPFRFLSSFF